jgi:hypothetical protein
VRLNEREQEMQRETSIAVLGPRLVCASMALALVVGAAPAALAYNAQITVDAGGYIYALDRTAPAGSKSFDPETFYTNLNIPIAVTRDTSFSVDPPGGNFLLTTGTYSASVVPGGLHLSARSANLISYAATSDADRYLRAQNGGNLQTSFDDTLTFSVARLAPGTPFLVDMVLDVHGSVSVFGGAPGSPITPNAYASGTGLWGFDLLVPGGRPAGVAQKYTDRYEDSAWFGVRDDGSTFDQFHQFHYPKTVTVTMYALSGVGSLLEMYARLGTAAFADATYWPEASGVVEAGVNGDLSNTVGWGGITGIYQLDGTPMSLADLTVQSTSGFDYTKAYVDAAPEPSTTWLLLIGVCCLWFARGRMARTQRVFDRYHSST